MPSEPRVAILGIGLVSSAGMSVDTTWSALISRQGYPVMEECWDGKERLVYRCMDRLNLNDMAVHAATQAMHQATLKPTAICVGSSSDTVAVREIHHDLRQVNTVTGLLAWGLEVPPQNCYQTANACASSSTAISIAYDLIRARKHRVVLAGGADMVCQSSIAGFASWRAYDVCRPFQKDRKGLALGEAAAFMILCGVSEEDSPPPVPPLAYIDGVGLACDATNMEGMDIAPILKTMIRALPNERWPKIDLVIAHGTGTPVNDSTESEAIRLFALHNGQEMPFVASYKGVLGHPQGASGAVGCVLAVKAMQEKKVWSTLPRATDSDESLAVSGVLEVLAMAQPSGLKLDNVLVLSHGTWGVYSTIRLSDEVAV